MDATEYACDLGIPTDPAFACIVKLAQVSAEGRGRHGAPRLTDIVALGQFIEFSAVNTKK